jgi:hypothetical protein
LIEARWPSALSARIPRHAWPTSAFRSSTAPPTLPPPEGVNRTEPSRQMDPKARMKRFRSKSTSAPAWVKVNLRLATVCGLFGVVMMVRAMHELLKANPDRPLGKQMMIEASEPLGIGLCWSAIVIGVWRGRVKRERKSAYMHCIFCRYGLRPTSGRRINCGSPSLQPKGRWPKPHNRFAVPVLTRGPRRMSGRSRSGNDCR